MEIMLRKPTDLAEWYINRSWLVKKMWPILRMVRNVLTIFEIKVIFIWNPNKTCVLNRSLAVLGYLHNVIKMCIWRYKNALCMVLKIVVIYVIDDVKIYSRSKYFIVDIWPHQSYVCMYCNFISELFYNLPLNFF